MGAPVNTGIENFEEVILKLPIAERTKLAHWILESVVEEEESPDSRTEAEVDVAESKTERDIEWPPKDISLFEEPADKVSWLSKVNPPSADLSDEEWKKRVSAVAGLWSDLPDDYGDDIVSSRTISTREITLDD